MFRLGITADLSPNGSIHQETFITAIKLGYHHLGLDKKNVELIWENDHASEKGGIRAAKSLIKQKVAMVIGHYASAAAKSALPFYEAHNIPVFLPAATADILTEKFTCSYRICAKDSDLANFIKQNLKSTSSYSLYIGHDTSVHGKSLSSLITNNSKEINAVTITDEIYKAQKVLYVGNFSNSINFINSQLEHLSKVKEIYFTDDLVHPELPKALQFFKNKVFIFGYGDSKYCSTAKDICTEYFNKWQKYPPTYFLETFASMEILDQILAFDENPLKWSNLLINNNWSTVLGDIKFDKYGDSGIKRFAVWRIVNDQLVNEEF